MTTVSKIQFIPPPSQTPTSQSVPKRFLKGSISACCAVCVSHPFEVLKCRLQVQGEFAKRGSYKKHYSGVLNFVRDLRTIAAVDGVNGLYKGLTTGLVYTFIFNGTRLCIDQTCKPYYDVKSQPGTRACVAWASGAIGAWIGNPINIVKTQAQISSNIKEVGYQHKTRTKLTSSMIVRSLNPLSSSVRSGALRSGTGSMLQLTSFDYIKLGLFKFYDHYGITGYQQSPLLYLSVPSCFLAGIPMVIIRTPFDTVYTRVCNQPETNRFGILKMAGLTFRNEGVAGFYKGGMAAGGRSCIQTIITMFMMDYLSNFQFFK